MKLAFENESGVKRSWWRTSSSVSVGWFVQPERRLIGAILRWCHQPPSFKVPYQSFAGSHLVLNPLVLHVFGYGRCKGNGSALIDSISFSVSPRGGRERRARAIPSVLMRQTTPTWLKNTQVLKKKNIVGACTVYRLKFSENENFSDARELLFLKDLSEDGVDELLK